MVIKIQKWGNTQGLHLARQVLEDAHLSVGDEVDVTTWGGVIVIAPVRRIRGKQSAKELVARIPKNHKPAYGVGPSEVGEFTFKSPVCSGIFELRVAILPWKWPW